MQKKNKTKPTKNDKSKKVTQVKPAVKAITSNAKPGNTVKTAAVAMSKILRGIDNDASAIAKSQDALNKRIDKINQNVAVANKIMLGLSNFTVPVQVKTELAKKPAPAQKAPVAKPVVKKDQKPAKAAPVKVAASSEPKMPIKKAVDSVLSGSDSAKKASEIYTEITGKYGSWSRQSLYNALKDEKKYSKTGDGAEAKYSMVSDSGQKDEAVTVVVTEEETDLLIKKMEENSAPLAGLI